MRQTDCKRSRRGSRRSKSRGGAALESTLVLLVSIMLFVGIADFGQIIFIHQTLVERTRLAARTGAIHANNDATIQNLVLYGQAAAPTDGRGPLFGLAPSNVTITRPDAGTTAQRLVVRVSGLRYSSFSPLMAGRFSNIPVTVAVSLENAN